MTRPAAWRRWWFEPLDALPPAVARDRREARSWALCAAFLAFVLCVGTWWDLIVVLAVISPLCAIAANQAGVHAGRAAGYMSGWRAAASPTHVWKAPELWREPA